MAPLVAVASMRALHLDHRNMYCILIPCRYQELLTNPVFGGPLFGKGQLPGTKSHTHSAPCKVHRPVAPGASADLNVRPASATLEKPEGPSDDFTSILLDDFTSGKCGAIKATGIEPMAKSC